jgi:dienelactone hydrolase
VKNPAIRPVLFLFAPLLAWAVFACSTDGAAEAPGPSGGAANTGATGAESSSGGTSDERATGGALSTATNATGGTSATGGSSTPGTGGTSATGGMTSAGGSSTPGTGGTTATESSSTPGTEGTTAMGGTSTGGSATPDTGGTPDAGGSSTGSSATAGTSATEGGTTSGAPGTTRGPDPSLTSISANRGTFATAELTIPAGNGFGGGFIYYPTDTSHGTWAGVAICPGGGAKFADEETWMGHWLASFGFVIIGIETNAVSNLPDSRGVQLLAALDYLTQESEVKERVDPNRLMVMGHSMGGGGTFHAALARPSLKTMVSLAPWFNSELTHPDFSSLQMPAMIISAKNDTVVTPASVSSMYDDIPTTTQRAWVELAEDDHLGFIEENYTEMRVLIPWMKIFLDNDSRYVQFLCPMANSDNISVYENSCPLVP